MKITGFQLPALICALIFLAAYPVAASALITDPDELFTAAGSPSSENMRFSITGDVAFVTDGANPRIDIIHRNQIQLIWPTSTNLISIKSGNRISIQGHLAKPSEAISAEGSSSLAIYADSAHVVGMASPLQFEEISGGRLACGDFTNKLLSVRGVLSSARRDRYNSGWNWFSLRTTTGKVFVATPDRECSIDRLHAMTDAEVIVKGIAHVASQYSKFIGCYLIPIWPDGISCTIPPLENPLLCPPLPERTLNGKILPEFIRPNWTHRYRVRGRVLGQNRNRVFITADNGYPCSILPGETSVFAPGSIVTAVGFPENNSFGPELTDASVHLEACPAAYSLPPGERVRAQSLFQEKDGKTLFSVKPHSAVIQLSGHVVNSRENILHEGIVRLACGVHTVPVDIGFLKDRLPEVPDAGYHLTVTGICFGDFSAKQPASELPVFTGFTIYPRVPEDIAVDARPPWWTAERLLYVICALSVLIVAFVIWNRSLSRLSERRGRQLYQEEIAHAKAILKVSERTQLAVELHDAVSQTLTGVALQIDSAILADRSGTSRVGKVLEVARAMLSSCRKELYNCIWDLRSQASEEKNMAETVIRALVPYSEGVKVSVRFNVPRGLFNETQLHTIVRIVRELAVNAINHGQATCLWIAGAHHDGMIGFSVRDNGRGFDPTKVPGPQQGHFGLQGVKERLDKLDGCIVIRSEKGKGTKIRVRLRIPGSGSLPAPDVPGFSQNAMT